MASRGRQVSGLGEGVVTPLPRVDADSAPYWQAAARDLLAIQQCADCQTPRFYPRVLCPACHSDRAEWFFASGRGTVHSYSIIHRAPSEYYKQRTPYVVALIDLDEGVRIFSTVESPTDEISIGDKVVVAFRVIADGVKLPVFVPAGSAKVSS
jgi:uncharacterized OB-fold protein